MKHLRTFLHSLFFILPAKLLAQSYGGLDKFGNNFGTPEPIIKTMANINIVFAFLGVIVVVGIIYGGFLMMTSAGNEERTGQWAENCGGRRNWSGNNFGGLRHRPICGW